MMTDKRSAVCCRKNKTAGESPESNMRELAKSTFSYFWSLSLLGAQQMANTILSPEKAAESFYVVGQKMVDEFGDLLNGAFQVGDAAQDYAADLAFDTLSFRSFNPAYISRFGESLARQSSDTLTNWGCEESRGLALTELKNKYEVYNIVKNAPLFSEAHGDGKFPLAELVEKAFSFGAYPDLWAVEGLGHDYAEYFWKSGKPFQNLLTDADAAILPAKSLTMMHAGIGLAFAQKLLPQLTPYSSPFEIDDVLGRFINLCRENSRSGYVGAAFESLGLVTRTWHPHLVGIVDKYLGARDEEILGHFWHGTGRALYFLPVYFVPDLLSVWDAAETEPPHEIGRRNAVAGLAWAKTLVNIRQPEIMLHLLRQRGERLARNDAFADGVASACIVGWDIPPGDDYIRSFCEYEPADADEQLNVLWRNLITNNCRAALQEIYPVLKRSEKLGEVFRYQSLTDLAARLNN